MNESADREAVEDCLKGGAAGEAAFRAIYERHALEVFRFLRRLLDENEAAEDALQETFVRLHRGLKQFDAARPLRPFVFSVARNVAIDVVRARSKRPKAEALPPDSPGTKPHAAWDAARASERRDLVHDALAALAPEHRSILLLRHVQGLKLEAIADAADCTARTAYNRLRAASVLFERELKRRGITGSEVVS